MAPFLAAARQPKRMAEKIACGYFLFAPAQLAAARGADTAALELLHTLVAAAENTDRLASLEDDAVLLYIDLQRRAIFDLHGAAQLDGQHDTAQLINFPHNTGRFQFDHPFLVIRDRRKAIETAQNM